MINNLQLLRGLAALGVVFYHTDFRIFGVHTDFMGVSIFFVISGFIMVHVTRENADGFFLKRIIRIVPLYWSLTLFYFALGASGLNNLPYVYPLLVNWLITDPIQIPKFILGNLFRNWDTWAVARSLLFIPSRDLPILGVGWTLNIEMFFYALFAVALTISQRWAPVIASAVLVFLFYLNQHGDFGPIIAAYGHDYVIFFVFGMALYYFWRAIKFGDRMAVVLGFALLAYWPYACAFKTMTWTMHYTLPCLVVAACLILHSAGVRLTNNLLIVFGGASYSLYLVHPILLETLRPTATVFPFLTLSTASGMVIAVVASSLAAMIVYSRFELPLINRLRTLMDQRTRLAPI